MHTEIMKEKSTLSSKCLLTPQCGSPSLGFQGGHGELGVVRSIPVPLPGAPFWPLAGAVSASFSDTRREMESLWSHMVATEASIV